MSGLSKREAILGLLALAPGSALAAQGNLGPLAAAGEGAGPIAQVYLAARPGRRHGDVLEKGWSPAAGAALSRRIKADYRAGRTFTCRGWRLSETEGRLFVMLAG